MNGPEPSAQNVAARAWILQAMRPAQWTKNLLLLAAVVFALGDKQQHFPILAAWPVLPAFIIFCALSSGIYILNDLVDVNADRLHPVKCKRPVASGQLSLQTARTVSALLLTAALVAALLLSRPFALVCAAYLSIQILYTFLLKKIPLLDTIVISGGFVLRAIAGAVVLRVFISPWLLLCTFLLALFLALCKRRQEKVSSPDAESGSRPTLSKYNLHLLDQLISITASSTLVSYSIYTLWPGTVEKFGTHALGFTIPFVLFGLFRYLDLVYRHDQGERPEHVLLTDVPLLVDLALYGASVIAVFAFAG